MAKIQAQFKGTIKDEILGENIKIISHQILDPTARILRGIESLNRGGAFINLSPIRYKGILWTCYDYPYKEEPSKNLHKSLYAQMDSYIGKKKIADAGLYAAISYLKVAYSFSSCLKDIYFLVDDFVKELILPKTFRKELHKQIKKGKTELTEKDKAIFDDEAKHYLKEIEIYQLNMHLFGD